MERRNQLRYQAQSTTVSIDQFNCCIKAKRQTLEHQCVDISVNGMGISSQSYLNVGQVVEIDLSINKEFLQLKGLVCNRRQQDGVYRLGISFALVPQQHQRLQQLLSELKLPLRA